MFVLGVKNVITLLCFVFVMNSGWSCLFAMNYVPCVPSTGALMGFTGWFPPLVPKFESKGHAWKCLERELHYFYRIAADGEVEGGFDVKTKELQASCDRFFVEGSHDVTLHALAPMIIYCSGNVRGLGTLSESWCLASKGFFLKNNSSAHCLSGYLKCYCNVGCFIATTMLQDDLLDALSQDAADVFSVADNEAIGNALDQNKVIVFLHQTE